MTEQKFYTGDIVAVRPFEEIDTSDIGRLQYDAQIKKCYGIRKSTIAVRADLGFQFKITGHSCDNGSHVYRIETVDDGRLADFYWAQGMLYGLCDREDPCDVEAPGEDLMDFLFAGGTA